MIAAFGGTFDPPHLGHKEAISGLFQEPGVKSVLVIPAASPPHKPCVATAEQRAAMANLCFRLPDVKIDLRELTRAKARPDVPTFSFDTIQELKTEYPDLAFVVGADQLAKLHTWHRFPELLGLCHWIVLERRPAGDKLIGETLQHWTSSGLIRPENERRHRTLNGKSLITAFTPARAVSSSMIRETIARSGSAPIDSISPDVNAYLKMHRIYGTTSDTTSNQEKN